MDSEKVLLVSFPKSGSNWVRYCIEYFSGMRTPGSKRHPLVHSGPYIIDRTHFIDKSHRRDFEQGKCGPDGANGQDDRESWFDRTFMQLKTKRRVEKIIRNQRLILLLRSPYESFARTKLLSPEGMTGYLSNIQIFDACRKDKVLVYYEDLVKDFGEMTKILDFIGVPYDLNSFDLDYHRHKSFELYNKKPNDTRTRNDIYNFSFHSKSLPDDTKNSLQQFAVSYLGDDLYEKYLSRFDRQVETT